jgi:hypothetical protein
MGPSKALWSGFEPSVCGTGVKREVLGAWEQDSLLIPAPPAWGQLKPSLVGAGGRCLKVESPWMWEFRRGGTGTPVLLTCAQAHAHPYRHHQCQRHGGGRGFGFGFLVGPWEDSSVSGAWF